ncbi:hypothetical protein TWF694_011844 [Orbilia ellipsospora]|uniref:Cysteine-rich transmembrane CYSTM domain-containing protein n=1 Tax=Orbilia ellipsospora TaxID=2528407 RepID=A0AAV9X6H2_9PEZI
MNSNIHPPPRASTRQPPNLFGMVPPLIERPPVSSNISVNARDFAYSPTSSTSRIWPPPSTADPFNKFRLHQFVTNSIKNGMSGVGGTPVWQPGSWIATDKGVLTCQPSPVARQPSPLSKEISPEGVKGVNYWNNVMEKEERLAEYRAAQQGCLLNRVFGSCCCCCCCDLI